MGLCNAVFLAPPPHHHIFFGGKQFLWKKNAHLVMKKPFFTLKRDFLCAQTAATQKKGDSLMNGFKTSKKLRISRLYYNNGFTETGAVPYIRLRGYWLKRHGFNIGQLISVCAEDGKISITPVLEVRKSENQLKNGQVNSLPQKACQGIGGNGSKARNCITAKQFQNDLF